MITADEARELVSTSDSEVERILKELDPKIRAAATTGKKSLVCDIAGTWDSKPMYVALPKPTPIQARLMAKLEQLGFGARLKVDGLPYIPAGLQDSCGEGPEHKNVCIVITW